MNRRQFLASAAITRLYGADKKGTPERPNIVIILGSDKEVKVG